MAACIDLNNCFGDRFRVEHEQSYQAERGPGSRLHDPWMLVIPCHHGHIYPHGDKMLAASTDHRGPIANRLAALPATTVLQDGEDGLNVAFKIDDFETVAEVMKPRRKRQLTPSQRLEQSERLRNYQFSRATQDAGDERSRDPAPHPAPKAISTRSRVI